MSRSRPTLILHIGWPKTGTTSIQSFLQQCDSGLLRSDKIFYPREGRGEAPAHYGLSRVLLDPAGEHREAVRALYRELNRERSWFNCAVISCEDFVRLRPPVIRVLHQVLSRGEWDVKILSYIRLPDHYLESLYVELNKAGMRLDPWPKFRDRQFEKGYPDYTGVLARWTRFFGETAHIVRPYDPWQWPDQNLLADFCQSIGATSLVSHAHQSRREHNRSPDADTFALITEINRFARESGVNIPLGTLKQKLLPALTQARAEFGGPVSRLELFSASERHDLRERYAQTWQSLGIHFSDEVCAIREQQGDTVKSLESLDSAMVQQMLIHGTVSLLEQLGRALKHSARNAADKQPTPRAA